MKLRLAGLFLCGAGLLVAGPDGACTISPANLVTSYSKLVRDVSSTIAVSTSGCTTPFRAFQVASGTLPPGLSLTSGTTGATISGIPTASGVYSFTLRAIDSAYKMPNESVIIQVNDPLQIDTPAAATGTASAAYTDTIRAHGGAAPYTFTVVSGALPSGLILNAATGAITGTMPATGTTFRIRVTDSSSTPATAEKPYTIVPAGQITTVAAPPVGSTGTSYSFDIDGSLGSSGFAVALGALPPGLTMDANGVISGTPNTVGEYHFTVRQISGTASVWRSYRIFVNSAATVSGTPRNAEETASYNHVFAVSGGVAPYTYAVTSGVLPTGLSLSADTGAITGTLPVSGAGTIFTITATDASGRAYAQGFTITSVTKLTGSTTTPPTVRTSLSQSATPYSLSNGGAGKQFALIGGVGDQQIFINPTTGSTSYSFSTPGTYVPVVLGSDSLGGTVLFNAVSYKAVGPLQLDTTLEIPNGLTGQPYSHSLAYKYGDFGPLNFAVTTGTLPTGITLNPTTGVLSGTADPMEGAVSESFQVTLTDSAGQSSVGDYYIAFGNNGRITTLKLAAATLGAPYNDAIAITGAVLPEFSIYSGSLPTGIEMNNAGALFGTPSVAGTYSFVVSVFDSMSYDFSSKHYTINVASPMSYSISPPTTGEATVGSSSYFPITQSNGATPSTLSISSGTLPDGMFLVMAGSTLALGGTPMIEGNQTFTILGTDAYGRTASIPYTVNVRKQLRISPATLPTVTRNVSYSTPLSASDGLAPYTWSLDSGTLPTGLTISPAGVISGLPTANGTFNFTVLVTDPAGRGDERTYILEVNDANAITNGVPLPNGLLQNAYSANITTTGGSASRTFSISDSDTAPLLAINPVTGVLSGLPLLSGTFPFTLQVKDSLGRTAFQSQQVTIQGGLSFTPPTLPNGTVNVPYSVTFTPTNNIGAVTWTVSAGSLPPGLTLNPSTGVLSGTPTTPGPGPFSFTIQAVDSTLIPVTRSYTVTILGVLTVNPATVANATINSPYSQQLTVSGATGAVAWSVTAGALPAGVTLGASTGLLGGTPTAAGSFSFTVTATDSLTQTGSRAYTMSVLNTLAIAPASLPNTTVNTPYSQQLTASGATGAVGWAVTAGALPTGLTLGAASGIVGGTPTVAGSFSFTVTATDSLTQTGSRAYSITVLNSLIIAPASLPNATINSPYSQQLTVTGATGAVGWAVTAGALPGGLTLAPSTGLLSGTPTTPGAFTFTVTATDSLTQTGSRAYGLTVNGVLAIAPPAVSNATINLPYSQQLTASGASGAVTWAVSPASGTLPPGLTLAPATGLISGTPTAAGSFPFTVTATDAATQTGSQAYTLTVLNVLTINPATLPNATNNAPYTQQLTVTGATGAVTWSVSAGTLPAGLTLGPTSGAITGSPTTPGASTFTVTATDSLTQTGSRVYGLTVNGVLTISPPSVPNATINTPYSQQLAASGASGAVTWALSPASGALPAGVTLAPATGLLSGTPTVAGTFPFSVTATDAASQSGSQAYTLTVLNVLTLTPASLPAATINTPYTQQITVTGATGAVTWSVSAGTLPAGLTLGPTSGAITGTPTSAGPSTFTVTATDSLTQAGSRVYTLTVNGVLTVLPQTVPNGTVNSPYSQQLTATNANGAVTWAISAGALPAGLTLNPSSGLLSGTPTAPGTFSFTAAATDSVSQAGSRAYTMQVLNVLTIAPATLPNATAGTPFAETLVATGGGTTITWAVTAGALPAGITLNPSSGLLSGTPTTPGPATFTVTATDSLTQTGSRAYTLNVAAVLTITPGFLPTVYVGVPYTQPLTAGGATGAVTWSLVAGSSPNALPAGLALGPSTGVISGTTNVAPGTYPVRIQATDAQSQSGQQVYSLQVRTAVTINPPTLPNGSLGTNYNQTLTATGVGGTATFAVTSGTLPPGIVLAPSGALTGIPTALGTSSFDVTVTTTQEQSATRSYRLTVVDPLAITTTSLPDGTEQEIYSATLVATGAAPSNLTWSITSGTLPPGLTLNAATGGIGGSPTVGGTYNFTAQVASVSGSRASQPLSIVVVQFLSITTLSLGEATQGKSYSATLSAAGGRSPYTWSLSGSSLPAGLQLNPATGQIAGTSSVPEGTYPQNVVVTDSRGRTARRTLSLNVAEPAPPSLSITPETLPVGRVNQTYSATFNGSGGRPGYSFAIVQGAPPPGLALLNGVLSGTPTQEGTFRFTVNVTDSQSRVAGNLYTVVIEAALLPLTVTPASIAPSTQVGQALTLQFGATGGKAPYTFAITGNTPPGMSSNSSGVLSGTPSQGGTFAFNVEVTDSLGAKANRSYSLSVTGNLTITTLPPLPEGTVGKEYAVTFGVAGGRATYTWSITGNVPPGLAFTEGTLSGFPTTAGTFSFTVSVQDAQRLTASASFSITVWDKLEITNAPADSALVAGQPFNFAFTTRGGKPPVTFALTGGALPAGLTMDSAGVISGTPTGAGNFAFTAQASDALGSFAVQSAVLRVVPPLTITSSALPSGTVGSDYTAGLAATGGVAPLGTWSVSLGSLPAGLTLAPDGTISGKPTTAGLATFTVRITDATGAATTRVLTISVQLPPLPAVAIIGLPQFLPPGTQTNITIQLAAPFPVPVTGTLTIIFEPDAVNNADDPAVQFSSGGRTVTFTIPAGETTGTFPVFPLRLLSGTVAGTIRIRTTTFPESATPVPDAVLPITRSVPVITAGTAQVGTGTFTITIDGYSNTREIASATFRLTPAPGSSLATTDVPVPVASTFTTYYQSSASAPFGGLFRLAVPFTVNGPITDIDTVIVTVTNSVGTSQPFTVRLR